MSPTQEKVLKVVQEEIGPFAARHLKVENIKSSTLGPILSILWKKGYLYRLTYRTRLGWFYCTAPYNGFESYADHRSRLRALIGCAYLNR